MAQQYAASIAGEALRVSALDASGAIVFSPTSDTSIYTLESFISVSFTPEYEEGDEFVQKTASGATCVNYRMPSTLKQITLELAVCNPDPELDYLITGGALLTDVGGDSIGFAAPKTGELSEADYGVALEVWSRAIVDGKPDATLPYWHWVFPLVHLRPSGSRVVENGLMANTYDGYGIGNLGFGDGIGGSWAHAEETVGPYAYARTATTPPTGNGFVTGVTG